MIFPCIVEKNWQVKVAHTQEKENKITESLYTRILALNEILNCSYWLSKSINNKITRQFQGKVPEVISEPFKFCGSKTVRQDQDRFDDALKAKGTAENWVAYEG